MTRALLVIWVIPLSVLFGSSQTSPAQVAAPLDDGQASVTYREECSLCHAQDGSGTPLGPSLRSVLNSEESEAGIVEIIRTGYGDMPAIDGLSATDAAAIASYVVEAFGVSADASAGQGVYDAQCSDCHGIGGRGGSAPGLGHVSSPMIVSAIRSGRIGMPAYDEALLSDIQVASIAAYVLDSAPEESPGAAGSIRLLDWSLRGIHVLAVVVYLGGGILFHGSLRGALQLIPPGQASMVGSRVGRDFTYLSWTSLVLWGATGYWMVFRYGWGDQSAPLTLFLDPDRLDTAQGVSLFVMLSTWYLIVVFASIITFVLRPRLTRRVPPDADAESAQEVADSIASSSRWIDVLARVNFVLTLVGLISGAPFL